QADGLADEGAPDQDGGGNHQPAHRVGQVEGADNSGEESGGDVQAEGQADPRRGPGQKAEPVAADCGQYREDDDQDVEPGHSQESAAVAASAPAGPAGPTGPSPL